MDVLLRKLPKDYIDNTLIPTLITLEKQTEILGNIEQQYRFSYAHGRCSYFFGIFRFDLNRDVRAVAFLLAIGFDVNQINELKSAGRLTEKQFGKLNRQLKSALVKHTQQGAFHRNPALQEFYTAQGRVLVSRLQTALDTIGLAKPDIADQILRSKDLQLRLLDFANQFSLDSRTPIVQWLCGQPVAQTTSLSAGHILTGEDISRFVMGMHEGEQDNETYQQQATERLDVLNKFMDSLTKIESAQSVAQELPDIPQPPKKTKTSPRRKTPVKTASTTLTDQDPSS